MKNSIIYNLLGVMLCGVASQATADFCSSNYTDCCEWSVLDGKMTLGADWLYWKVHQDGIHSGTVAFTDSDLNPPSIFFKRKCIDPKWDSGFRVNLGYELPCDCWDVNFCYTYMPSHATSTFNAFAHETFRPSWTLDFNPDLFATFKSKWNITVNNIDLDIGRSVCFGECLTLRPHIGFRATWFDQKLRSHGLVLGEPNVFFASKLKQKFQGYGVEGGLWADYQLGCGLSLVGHFGGAILYSQFKSCGFQVISTGEGELQEAIGTASESDKCFTATPMMDYFVGLQYADTMCDMLFKVHLGWEQHVIFDTNRFLSAGNLSGQGLTLGLDVGF